MGALRKLLRRHVPRTHDLSHRRHWFKPEDEGLRASMGDWYHFAGGDPVPGDYFILADGDRTTRYRVTEFNRMMDPRDMWIAHVEFAPRSKEEL